MTAKEFLNRGRELDAEIEQLKRLKRKAYDQATSVTAATDKPPISGGAGRDVFASYAQYATALEEQTAELLDVQRSIREAIEQVPNGRYRRLLTARYIEGMTWEQIACDMAYSFRQVTRMHGSALRALTEIMS